MVLASVITLGLTIPLAFFTDAMNRPVLYLLCFLLGMFHSALVVVAFTSAKVLVPVEIAGNSVRLANLFPFLGLKIGAQIRETTLITGIYELYVQGMQVIAILVLITTVLVPFVQMMCLFYVLLPLKFGRMPKKLPRVVRFLHSIQPWSMMEVFLVGILVSMVKLAKMAKIIPGISLYSFLALIFVLAAMTVSLDTHLIWQKWDEHR